MSKKCLEMSKLEVIKFYADIPSGSVGIKTKQWTDPFGCTWVRLFFGRNLSGHKITRTIPIDFLKPYEK